MKTLNDILPTLENFVSEKRAAESVLTEKRAAIGRQLLELPEVKKALIDLENGYEEKGNYSLDSDGLKFSVSLPDIFPKDMEKAAKKEALECLELAVSDDGPYYLDSKAGELYCYHGPCITLNWNAGRREIFAYDGETDKTILVAVPTTNGSERVTVAAYVAAILCQYQSKQGIFNSVVETDYHGGFFRFFDLLKPLKEFGVTDLDDAAGIQSVIDLWNETSEEN